MATADTLMTTSRQVVSQNHPAELLPNSCPTENVRYKCLLVLAEFWGNLFHGSM